MALPQQERNFDFPAYLTWETALPERYEFIRGETFAMTGARGTHNTIAGNLFVILKTALRGTPCRTYIESVKLRVALADAVLYPDVFVTCAPQDATLEADLFKTSPVLVAEVLSESTAGYDRGLKFELYQQLERLQEYLLIEQDRRHVDLFRKNDEGLWVLHPARSGETLRLTSVGVDLAVDALYEDLGELAPS